MSLALSLPGGYSIEYPESLSGFAFEGAPITAILDSAYERILVFAGLLLLLFLIWGGFEMLTSGGNPESLAKGQKKVTNALIGFIIVFASYWIAQILQTIFGIQILESTSSRF